MITTNDQKPSAPVEPKKLNHITTAIIPNAEPKPEGWRPKGDGFAKMITTHDAAFGRDVDDMSKDKPVELKKGPGRPKGTK